MERRVLALFALFGVMPAAHALDFRSIEVPAAILYDAPSQKGKKLYLIREQTPVEVVVRIEGWLKVRDAEGTMAWIEARNLGERRTLIVTAPGAEIRPCDKTDAAAVAAADLAARQLKVELLPRSVESPEQLRRALLELRPGDGILAD